MKELPELFSGAAVRVSRKAVHSRHLYPDVGRTLLDSGPPLWLMRANGAALPPRHAGLPRLPSGFGFSRTLAPDLSGLDLDS